MIGAYLPARRRPHGGRCWQLRAEHLDQGQRRRHRAHHADHARNGAGRDDVDADARRRGARLRLERRSRPSGPAPMPKYGNPNFGGQQLTAGSNSVRGMWKVLRESAPPRARCSSPPPRRPGAFPRTSLTTEKGEVDSSGQRSACEVRRARGQGRDAAGAEDGHAEGSEGRSRSSVSRCRDSTCPRRSTARRSSAST